MQLTIEVICRLQKYNLVIASDQCKWHQKYIEILGNLKSGEDLSTVEDRIDIALKWVIPESV
jgi:hypothetical protein